MGKRRIVMAMGPRGGVRTTRIVVPREFTSRDLRIVYFEAGVGAPIVMLHGLGGSSRWWFPLFPELTSANFRLIAPDLPAFGRSPGPMLPINKAARSVIDLADRSGLGEFFLCGHSMGGAIAARIAADFGSRVRRLVLIDSAGIPGVGPARILGRIVQPWSWCPGGFYSTLLGDMVRAGPNLFRGMRHLRSCDIRPSLKRIRTPALVIWGKKDGLTPLRHGHAFSERLANARLEVIPGARHLPMVSHPEAVSRLIVRFLKEDLEARSEG